MNLQDIIDTVGLAKYKSASAEARLAAPFTGKKHDGLHFDSDIPHDIGGMIWWDAKDISFEDKLALTFCVYEDIPCYGVLMYIHYPDLPTQAQEIFWDYYRGYMSSEDEALAQPVAYSLWCDYFEDWRLDEHTWQEIVRDDASPTLLRHVLDVSGPVPFALKEKLYERLISNKSWHPAIFRSLLYSNYDVYGQIEKDKARNLLLQLELPPDTYYMAELFDALGIKQEQ